jgi:hypothetical protein
MPLPQLISNIPNTRKFFSDKYFPQQNDSRARIIQKISLLCFSILGLFTLLADLYYYFRTSSQPILLEHQPPAFTAQEHPDATATPPIAPTFQTPHNPDISIPDRPFPLATIPSTSNLWIQGTKIAAVAIGAICITALCYSAYRSWRYSIAPTANHSDLSSGLLQTPSSILRPLIRPPHLVLPNPPTQSQALSDLSQSTDLRAFLPTCPISNFTRFALPKPTANMPTCPVSNFTRLALPKPTAIMPTFPVSNFTHLAPPKPTSIISICPVSKFIHPALPEPTASAQDALHQHLPTSPCQSQLQSCQHELQQTLLASHCQSQLQSCQRDLGQCQSQSIQQRPIDPTTSNLVCGVAQPQQTTIKSASSSENPRMESGSSEAAKNKDLLLWKVTKTVFKILNAKTYYPSIYSKIMFIARPILIYNLCRPELYMI